MMLVINRSLLGLLMVVPGLIFLWHQITDNGSSAFLASIGFSLVVPLAWIIILSQLIFGGMVLFGKHMKYAPLPLAFILLVAALTVWWANWPQMILHITVASNYLVFSLMEK